ncbi:MAG: cytochrome b5 domain-containing protein [bacterium]
MKKFTTISLFIFFAVVTAVLTAGLVFYQNNISSNVNTVNQHKNTDINNLVSSGITKLDSVEVSKHNIVSDCWIIVNNKVYDISGYASAHPGGTRNIADSCGKESTTSYDTKGGRGQTHSINANQELAQFLIGDLNQKIDQSTLSKNVQNAKANTTTSNSNNIVPNVIPTDTVTNTKLTTTEVTKHNTTSDCWIIVNSKVYNISGYASSHPGGTRNIANYCGKEATNAFDTKGGQGSSHSTSANNLLDQFLVGNLNQQVSQNTINTNTQNAQVNNTNTNKGGDYEVD